ncbi:putative 2-(5''-triphosphoribosyl)-3'-dephospho-CoA synthase [Pseudomonas plecoglossicida]|nr:putative 2-(5''-triphosphoribosyl)-3'-dephospho-CoA synthase [Pseudomonas plecoglossicida]
MHILYRSLRGHARSHRCSAVLKTCAVPVGAGLPAKRPPQATAPLLRFSEKNSMGLLT